jgi:hypothetical protein
MSDQPTPSQGAPARPPAAETNGQLIVSLAIVGVLGSVAVGLIVAGCITGKWDQVGTGIGTAIGALATALNAPTGISNMVRAIKTGDGQ